MEDYKEDLQSMLLSIDLYVCNQYTIQQLMVAWLGYRFSIFRFSSFVFQFGCWPTT